MTKDEMMNLINRSLFATMGYTDEEGIQNIRRVFCVWHKGLGRHLISTNTGSSHVRSLMKNGKGCLYFSDDSSFEGLCLYGCFVIHFEKEYRELLWNEGDEKYYPKGVEDEDYCILEFIAGSGRFYRYDGKGDLSLSEIEAYDQGKEFYNGYNAVQQQKMDVKTFFNDVISQNEDRLGTYFCEDAVIRWHCSNESFTVEEYTRANCEYPDSWEGEIERLEEYGDEAVVAARVYPKEGNESHHVVSFIRLKDDKIVSIDEYWAEDGEVPEWRKQMHIGKKIR